MLLETKCKSGTIKKGKERKKTRTSGAVLESVPNVIAPFLFVSGLISLFFYLFFFQHHPRPTRYGSNPDQEQFGE
jgi:hypothetical protein